MRGGSVTTATIASTVMDVDIHHIWEPAQLMLAETKGPELKGLRAFWMERTSDMLDFLELRRWCPQSSSCLRRQLD